MNTTMNHPITNQLSGLSDIPGISGISHTIDQASTMASRAAEQITTRTDNFTIKDRWSAITHFIGAIASATALPFLMTHVKDRGVSGVVGLGFLIFGLCMICLYTASTCYHTFDISPSVNEHLKKFDHLSIFLLIAGSYTPICLTALAGRTGYTLLAVVWGIAIVGMIIKFFWIYCPKWFSSVLYLMMGWAVGAALPQLWNSISHTAFLLLLFGGIAYSIGGVIYALTGKKFNARHPQFGTHEIFHVFVLLGSLLHFIMIYGYLV